jgi:hypothetical protein
MKQPPGSKITPAPCDACGRPKVALYPIGGRDICMDCHEGGPKPEPKPVPMTDEEAWQIVKDVLEHYAADTTWGTRGDPAGPKAGKYYQAPGRGAGPARRLLKKLRGE